MDNVEHNIPLVSIIVITYNSSKYVLETLESAKAQTYQNIELIISDDSSLDDTVEICENWLSKNQERFVRVELISSEKNTGISANCNRGVYSSKGEWIKLIAGDDILLNECVKLNLSYIAKKHVSNILFSQCQLFKIVNDKIVYLNKQPSHQQIKMFKLTSEEQFKMLLIQNFVWSAPTMFIKHEFLISIGYFNESYPMCEDYPLWLKITKKGFVLDFFELVTVLYRQSESVTNSNKKWMNKDYFNSIYRLFIVEITPYLKSQDKYQYQKKRNYFIKFYILINIFKNKKFLISNFFNKAFDNIISNIPL